MVLNRSDPPVGTLSVDLTYGGIIQLLDNYTYSDRFYSVGQCQEPVTMP